MKTNIIPITEEAAADRDHKHAAAFRDIENHVRNVARQKELLFSLPIEQTMDDLTLFATMQLGGRIDELLRAYDHPAKG
jgi:hypothetical protein